MLLHPPIHLPYLCHCHTTLPDIFLIGIASTIVLLPELFCSDHSPDIRIDTLFSALHSGWGSFQMEGEPSPRWGHYSALVEEKSCVWGGRTKDFLKENSELASSIHSFDPFLEFWDKNKLSGVPPPGLYYGACASAGHHVYLYGGHDGSCHQSSLHQLDTRSWTWKQLSSAGPMKKAACGMVACDSKLVLFGGYGIPSGPTQPGAEFIRSIGDSGWTNEVHTFNLKEGEGVRVGFTSHVTTKFPYGTWFSQLPLARFHIIILYLQHWPCLSFHTVEPLIKDIPNEGQPLNKGCSKCINFTSK